MNGLPFALGAVAVLVLGARLPRGAPNRASLADWPTDFLLEWVDEKGRHDARMADDFPDSETELDASVDRLEAYLAWWTRDHEAEVEPTWRLRWETGALLGEVRALLRSDTSREEARAELRRRRTP